MYAEPAIGISPSGFGDLSLYLAGGVEAVTASARSERTVTAELTAGWRDWIYDAIAAFIRRDTVRVEPWTVDFGDGTRRRAQRSMRSRAAAARSRRASWS